MDRLKAKQIEDAMDTVSTQVVSGEKRFAAPQAFLGSQWHIVIADGYIYWVQNPEILDDFGNQRLLIENGQLIIETFQGQWTRI
jgi:hypothetical protein